MTKTVDNQGASELTGLTIGTLTVMRSKGTGPKSFKRNGRVQYDVNQLLQWMADREAATLRGGMA